MKAKNGGSLQQVLREIQDCLNENMYCDPGETALRSSLLLPLRNDEKVFVPRHFSATQFYLDRHREQGAEMLSHLPDDMFVFC